MWCGVVWCAVVCRIGTPTKPGVYKQDIYLKPFESLSEIYEILRSLHYTISRL